MKSNYDIEVILASKFSPADPNQQELFKWLTNDALSMIEIQFDQTKDKVVRILNGTPPIHMS